MISLILAPLAKLALFFATTLGESHVKKLFAVRCLFLHLTRVKEGEGNLYEERITIWETEEWKEAYRQAEQEAKRYADESSSIFLSAVDSFHLFDGKVSSGTEVWSNMRDSKLHYEEYREKYLDGPDCRMHTLDARGEKYANESQEKL